MKKLLIIFISLIAVSMGCTKEEYFLPSDFVENESAQSSIKEGQANAPLPKVDATTLSLSHVVYYATKWADTSEANPEYDSFDPNDANFVSQTLKYAGLPMEVGVWEFDPLKCTKEERSTPAWRDSKCLPMYLIGKYNLETSLSIKELSEYENYKRDAQKGDIVFLDARIMVITMFEKKWVDDEYVVTRIFYSSSGKKNHDLSEVLPELGVTDSLRIIRLQV